MGLEVSRQFALETSRDHCFIHVKDEDLLFSFLSQFNGLKHDLLLVVLIVVLVSIEQIPAVLQEIEQFQIDQLRRVIVFLLHDGLSPEVLSLGEIITLLIIQTVI